MKKKIKLDETTTLILILTITICAITMLGCNLDQEEMKINSSIYELMTDRISLKCQNINNTFIAYISKDKYKIEPLSNEIRFTTMKVKNETYMWSYEKSKGLKFKTNKTTDKSFQVDPNKKMYFNCIFWNEDITKFTPPINVKFVELMEISDDINKQAANIVNDELDDWMGENDKCESCDLALNEEDKNLCRKSYGCID